MKNFSQKYFLHKNRFLIFIVIVSSIVFCSCALFAASHHSSSTSDANAKPLRVTFLDVWQGDCEIIRTPSGKVIMIDAGDREDNNNQNVAETRILPYLKANGINKIDIFIITHPHADHIGGLLTLIPKIPIGVVYENTPTTTQTYNNIIDMLKQKNIPVRKLWKGDKLDFGDGIDATVLHPPRQWVTLPITTGGPIVDTQNLISNSPYSLNGSAAGTDGDSATASAGDLATTVQDVKSNLNQFSIVLRMQYKNAVYHFAGDVENEGQTELMAGNPANLIPSGVYKVAHHGSKTSSLPSFMKKLKPAASVISSGAGNRFGHPSLVTVQNLQTYSAAVYRTDTNSTIESQTDGSSAPVFKTVRDIDGARDISEKLFNRIISKPEKIEQNVDYFINHLMACGDETLAVLSPTIKKALDRLKYDCNQNPETLKKLNERIDALQEIYDRSTLED